jgi:hypothetical protein
MRKTSLDLANSLNHLMLLNKATGAPDREPSDSWLDGHIRPSWSCG